MAHLMAEMATVSEFDRKIKTINKKDDTKYK